MPRRAMPLGQGRPGAGAKVAKTIVWLASYPKSGNTWLRAFLANYILNCEEPFPINQLNRFGSGDSDVNAFRAVAPATFDPTNDLDNQRRRPVVLGRIAGNGADMNFCKTHNQKDVVFGIPLIPAEVTRAALYVVRDPRDVVLSYASHFGRTLAQAVGRMADQTTSSGGLADSKTVRQFFGGWSSHVLSWTRHKDFPLHMVRYEDLIADPEAAFSEVLAFLGLPVEPDRLSRAAAHADFDTLKGQEQADGFRETGPEADRFFVSGKSGRWKTELPEELAAQIVSDHGAVMRQMGYL